MLRIIIIAAAGLIILLLVGLLWLWRRRKLRPLHFQRQWAELQKLCANKKSWPNAITGADKLLDEALKKKHFKGKTMGERLVSAQHELSNNDAVWSSHKLSSKVDHQSNLQLGKKQVRTALLGFLKALKDLNAL
ncbi:MAG TPA: hypothetical protein VMR08_03190 [Patescibacteria group bacterium]|jgi:hypothetical protein|nr:hypothetical protein [Patescibacteria group bacterium]